MISLFSSKPTVTPLDDDRVTVSFTIPAELLDDFSKLFDSLSGFIRIIQREKRLARLKRQSQSDIYSQQAEQNKLLYYQRIVKAYDEYTSQGLSRTAASKQISVLLCKEKPPWAFTDQIRSSIIDVIDLAALVDLGGNHEASTC